jgi:hypothetical protein
LYNFSFSGVVVPASNFTWVVQTLSSTVNIHQYSQLCQISFVRSRAWSCVNVTWFQTIVLPFFTNFVCSSWHGPRLILIIQCHISTSLHRKQEKGTFPLTKVHMSRSYCT